MKTFFKIDGTTTLWIEAETDSELVVLKNICAGTVALIVSPITLSTGEVITSGVTILGPPMVAADTGTGEVIGDLDAGSPIELGE